MSEDRFRFPDFFTLRVKIKVIRSGEWIDVRYNPINE